MDIEQIKALIRDVPDFPEPGIVFKDITPVLADPIAFSTITDLIVVHFGRGNVDKVVGIEARGFILASPVAYHFGAGFVPIRKKGKLPSDHDRRGVRARVRHGHRSSCTSTASPPGERVLIVDDVLATGGTAQAAASLVEQVGGKVCGIACLIELDFLHGREQARRPRALHVDPLLSRRGVASDAPYTGRTRRRVDSREEVSSSSRRSAAARGSHDRACAAVRPGHPRRSIRS